MREVVLRVPRVAVEDVLDRLLPLVPGGVRERPAGNAVELTVRGEGVPATAELRRAVGRWPCRLVEREAPDDWRERRAADYEPDVIGGRLVVRPQWAPPAPEGTIDVALGETAVFGGGTHPTTRACLELLLVLTPLGSFGDLGCGSGVLAIAAAKLGWTPVVAWDLQLAAIETTRDNAERNGVSLEVRSADLTAESPPRADGFAANVPGPVHAAIAAGWGTSLPRVGLVSGVQTPDAPAVLEAYAARGLHERRRIDAGGWAAALVER